MGNEDKKVLLVLTGGTICTVIKEENGKEIRYIPSGEISDKIATVLEDKYKESESLWKDTVDFDTFEDKCYGILSENMTIGKWNSLIRDLRNNRDSLNDYAGIIILHGTDTLAYSSALFSLLLRNIGIPVFLVSSNKPPEDSTTNAHVNFRRAVECICFGIKPNVYVVYENNDKDYDGSLQRNVYLHLASRLTQCDNYSENFYSKGSINITSFSQASDFSGLFDEIIINNSDLVPKVDLTNCPSLCNTVLKIDPYVGLDYASFNYSKYHAVIHGAYHSGTVCVDVKTKAEVENKEYGTDSILWMLDECENNKVDVFIHPGTMTYESSQFLFDHPCKKHVLYGCTNEMVYIKLLLAYAYNVNDVDSFIETEFNGEMMY